MTASSTFLQAQKQWTQHLIFFSSYILSAIREESSEKSNVPLVQKNLIKSDRPINLFPIFSKVFERFAFDSLNNILCKTMFSLSVSLILFLMIHVLLNFNQLHTKTVTGGVLEKKVFLRISQISQENACVGVSYLIKLQTSSLQIN